MGHALIEELEPRILHAADTFMLQDALVSCLEVGDRAQVAREVAIHDDAQRQEARVREVAFIDANTPEFDTLIADIQAQAEGDRTIEIFVLRSDEDGIAQISRVLSWRTDIAAVHLISHGGDGAVQVGGARLDAATLRQYVHEISGWREALSPQADLLIYGCDVARTALGRDLMSELARVTGADVAASDDTTGSESLGGDWVLEYRQGEVQASILSPSAGTSWRGLLATLLVTTTADVVDGDTTSAAALLATRGADGFISLREAILATNNSSGSDIINLGAGTYTLSITGTGEDAAAAGDLDILGELTISGVSAATSIIDAGGLDRVFDILTSRPVTFQDVTIQNGQVSSGDGGGIQVGTAGNVRVERSILTSNSARDGGALAASDATLTVVDSSLTSNAATSNGGGIFSFKSSVTLSGSTLSLNTSGSTGGGIESQGANATLTLTNVTLSGNSASSQGGALFNQRDATITNSTIAYNVSGGVGGAVTSTGAATLTLKNTILADNVNGNASGSLTSAGYNIDTDGSAGLSAAGDISGVSAQLHAVLQNNGGHTATHALLVGSPAINAGTSTGTPSSDQRGFVRVGATDIGAFEASAAVVATPPTNIALSNDTEPENIDTTGGYSVGNLTATDPDALETFVYSVTGGVDGASFSIGGVSSNELLLNAGILDYESKSSYVVRVAVVDSTGNRYEKTFTVDVANVNESPVNAIPSSGAAVSGSAIVFSTGNGNALRVSDPDAGATSIRVTISVASGELTLSGVTGLSFTTGDGIADATMVIVGSLTNINAALNGLSFLPAAGVLGAVTLTILSEDLGNTGSGAPLTDTDSFSITVSAALPALPTPMLLPLSTTTTKPEGIGSATSADAEDSESEATEESGEGSAGFALATGQLGLTREEPTEQAPSSFLGTAGLGRAGGVARGSHVATIHSEKSDGNHGDSARADDTSLAPTSIRNQRMAPLAAQVVQSSLGAEQWLEQLRRVREQLERDAPLSKSMIGTTAFVSGGLSVGYIVWILRGGVLMSTVLSSLPAWQTIDPMPILGQRPQADDVAKSDPIERMFEKVRERVGKVRGLRIAGKNAGHVTTRGHA